MQSINSTIGRKDIIHGGRLYEAAAKFNIPISDWLDLSTGINPNGWPVPVVPSQVWQRLPQDNDELEHVACQYYGVSTLLPIAGSQAAIQNLPRIRVRSRVGVLWPTYNEHAFSWRIAGHDVVELMVDDIPRALDRLDVLVVVNPNNPTGNMLSRENLLEWRQILNEKGGWLIVDEAFMDAVPSHSIAQYSGLPGLVILRSLGKFFGLAGCRVGFVLAEPLLLQALREILGPWTICGASRYLAARALADRDWQSMARTELRERSARLRELLQESGLPPTGGTAYFQWTVTNRAPEIYVALAQRGVLVRYWPNPSSLRFGLPSSDEQWRRLENLLHDLKATIT